jgi:monofunctional biosynthetic peptidoglycan transglycosylase
MPRFIGVIYRPISLSLATTRRLVITLLCCFNTVWIANSRADTSDMSLIFKFTGESSSPAWAANNDGVMGGLSQGGAQLVEGGMLFSGELSLENNGGFASVYAEDSFNLSEYAGIRFSVLGDGRTYLLRLQSDAVFRQRGWVAFSREFATVKGEWIEVFVPFSELKQSWRGRRLSGYTFNAGDIRRIGFMLADKQPGSFRLKVRWVAAALFPAIRSGPFLDHRQ